MFLLWKPHPFVTPDAFCRAGHLDAEGPLGGCQLPPTDASCVRTHRKAVLSLPPTDSMDQLEQVKYTVFLPADNPPEKMQALCENSHYSSAEKLRNECQCYQYRSSSACVTT